VLVSVNADTVGREEHREYVIIEFECLVGGEAAEAREQRDALSWRKVADVAHAVGGDLIVNAAIGTDGIIRDKYITEMISQIVSIVWNITA
jgi:hypothetical protein